MSTANDDISRGEQLELEYDHGVKLIRDLDADEYHRYRFEAPLQKTLYWYEEDRGRARLFAQLSAALGGFSYEDVGKKGIPVGIARAGQEELVCYIVAHPSWKESARSAARRFELEQQTVYQYQTRVRERAPEPITDRDGN